MSVAAIGKAKQKFPLHLLFKSRKKHVTTKAGRQLTITYDTSEIILIFDNILRLIDLQFPYKIQQTINCTVRLR